MINNHIGLLKFIFPHYYNGETFHGVWFPVFSLQPDN